MGAAHAANSQRTAGLPLPIMMNLAGCAMEMPSRSTVLTPDAEESSTTSTRPSSSRFTSSTYRMPRLARAWLLKQGAGRRQEAGCAWLSVCKQETAGVCSACVHTQFNRAREEPQGEGARNPPAFVVPPRPPSTCVPSNRLTSSPGSKALTPSVSAFSMSIVPQMRSSVAPSGSSTLRLVWSWMLPDSKQRAGDRRRGRLQVSGGCS